MENLPPDILERVSAMADANFLTPEEWIVQALKESLDREEAEYHQLHKDDLEEWDAVDVDAKPPTWAHYSARLPFPVFGALAECAAERGETIAQVIERAATGYVNSWHNGPKTEGGTGLVRILKAS